MYFGGMAIVGVQIPFAVFALYGVTTGVQKLSGGWGTKVNTVICSTKRKSEGRVLVQIWRQVGRNQRSDMLRRGRRKGKYSYKMEVMLGKRTQTIPYHLG
jgi:hypothetical protein